MPPPPQCTGSQICCNAKGSPMQRAMGFESRITVSSSFYPFDLKRLS